MSATTIGKSKVFAAALIQNLRIEKRAFKARGKTAIKYAIAFDYLGKKEDLLTSLSLGRADSLLADLRTRLVRRHA